MSRAAAHDIIFSGRDGQIRYHSHTVALLTKWRRDRANLDKRVGTTVARLTFTPGTINQFWANFGQPTHVALPVRRKSSGTNGPQGPSRLRVYELIEFNLAAGRATFRTPPCRIEEPIR
jgi:hypothetical protein